MTESEKVVFVLKLFTILYLLSGEAAHKRLLLVPEKNTFLHSVTIHSATQFCRLTVDEPTRSGYWTKIAVDDRPRYGIHVDKHVRHNLYLRAGQSFT